MTGFATPPNADQQRVTGFTLEIESRDEEVLNRLLDAMWRETDLIRRAEEARRRDVSIGGTHFPLQTPLPFTGRLTVRSAIV